MDYDTYVKPEGSTPYIIGPVYSIPFINEWWSGAIEERGDETAEDVSAELNSWLVQNARVYGEICETAKSPAGKWFDTYAGALCVTRELVEDFPSHDVGDIAHWYLTKCVSVSVKKAVAGSPGMMLYWRRVPEIKKEYCFDTDGHVYIVSYRMVMDEPTELQEGVKND